jgi:hypothetical protein
MMGDECACKMTETGVFFKKQEMVDGISPWELYTTRTIMAHLK